MGGSWSRWRTTAAAAPTSREAGCRASRTAPRRWEARSSSTVRPARAPAFASACPCRDFPRVALKGAQWERPPRERSVPGSGRPTTERGRDEEFRESDQGDCGPRRALERPAQEARDHRLAGVRLLRDEPDDQRFAYAA